MENKKFLNNEFKSLVESSEDVDLGDYLNIVIRRKLIIFSLTLLGLIASFYYSKQKTLIYEGGFQIVLETQSNSKSPFDISSNSTPLLAGLASSFQSSQSRNIKTEVNILKSSSVLKPVYKFVIKEKYNNDFSKLPYKSWLNGSLDIKLVKGTSVLDISYFDSKKELIKPVLQKISDVYQIYSGKERRLGLTKSLKYTEDQLEKIKIKSRESLFEYQKFALENSLGNIDGLPKLRSNNFQLGNINDIAKLRLKNNKDQTSIRYDETYKTLILLENIYLSKSAYLKPNSEYLKNLKSKISKLEKALYRPKEVLLKHRELQRNAVRDEELLSTLENQVISLKLQIAQQNDPWKLISDTTIIEDPVSPKIKETLIFGFLASLSLSILIAFIIDRLTGLVYSKDYFKNNLPTPYLFSLPFNKNLIWAESIDLLLSSISSAKGLNLFILSSNEEIEECIFCDYVKNRLQKKLEVITTQSISDLNQEYITLLVCSSGTTKREKLAIIINQLKFLKRSPIGWIYLDKNSKL